MLVFEYESNCPNERFGTIGGMPSVEVILIDPSPYLREINGNQGLVDKNDRSPAPAVYEFWAQYHSATGGGFYN